MKKYVNVSAIETKEGNFLVCAAHICFYLNYTMEVYVRAATMEEWKKATTTKWGKEKEFEVQLERYLYERFKKFAQRDLTSKEWQMRVSEHRINHGTEYTFKVGGKIMRVIWITGITYLPENIYENLEPEEYRRLKEPKINKLENSKKTKSLT